MRVNLLYFVGIIGLCCVLASVGCSSTPHVRRSLVNPRASIHTADHNQGYADGCASGRNAVGDADYKFSKDNSKHAINAEYRAGWDEGYAMCQEDYLAEVQNKVKQTVDLSTDDKNTTALREKIWNELKK